MEKWFYIGLDIGGWKIRGVLWDGRHVLARTETRTPGTKAAFLRAVRRLTGWLSRKAQNRVRGMGIGVAGGITGKSVVYSPNISYLKNFNFQKLALPAPFRLDNDARAFCRAEARLGAGKGFRRILAFTIGTGIGRAYAAEGRVKVIKKFEYPERWEKKYQRVRDRGDTLTLAVFLNEKLAAISKQYRPAIIILGGGVLVRPKMFALLKSEFRRQGVKAAVRRGRLGPNAAAIGAALLFQRA